MWEDDYCWAVLCKNRWFHMRQNLFFKHKIALAVTDAFAPLPSLDGPFKVRCDECGKAYFYKPSEIVRIEQELPKLFKAHPLFQGEPSRDEESYVSNQMTELHPPQEEPPQEERLQEAGSQEETSQKKSLQIETPQEPPEEEQTRAKGA